MDRLADVVKRGSYSNVVGVERDLEPSEPEKQSVGGLAHELRVANEPKGRADVHEELHRLFPVGGVMDSLLATRGGLATRIVRRGGAVARACLQ